jgi:hypothetical protein
MRFARSRAPDRQALSVGLVRFIGLFAASVIIAFSGNDRSDRLAREAARAEKAGDLVQAYLLYAQAAVGDRNNMAYWAKAETLRPKAEARSLVTLPALELKPEEFKPFVGTPVIGSFTPEDLVDLERMLPPPRLRPSILLKPFHLKADAKTLFNQVAREFGYTVIFDKDYSPTGIVRFDIGEAGYRDVLHALESATSSFIVPIADTAMLVAQDTPQKRTELENDEAQAIPIPQRTSVQEAQELLTMVQQTFEIRRAVLDPQRRMILLRDRVSKIEAASAILSQLSVGKPQVSIEVEFLSTDDTSSLSFGIRLPTQFPLVSFGQILNNVLPSTDAGFMRYLTFAAGKTFLGLGIGDATLLATASRSSARSLLRSTIMASDGQPASLHLGAKYPIVTAGYFGGGNTPGGGGVGTPGGVTYAVLTTTPYVDIISSPVSTTGTMRLVVNGVQLPLFLPGIANNLSGLQSAINNSTQAGVIASVIQRGTNDKPYSLVLAASTLGVTSIQLFDDPDGANILLTKTQDILSAISGNYADATKAKVSQLGTLSLAVGTETPFPLTLATDQNNLNGLRDAINAAKAGVTAGVLLSNLSTGNVYLQVVADAGTTTQIQVYDDPAAANVPLLTRTDQVDQTQFQLGQTIGGTTGGSITGSNIGQVYTPPPTFTFEDLGLILKVTPTVHSAEEVSLDVEAEFKLLGASSYNGIPVIANRKFQGKVRLRSTEWAVVAGLFTDEQSRAISGIPGLVDIPAFGVALRENTKSKTQNNVLIVIKPTVTSLPGSEYATRTLWVGSETRPLSPL